MDGRALPETPYVNSVILSGALWDMRQTSSIGANLADELIFGALDRNPVEFNTMLDALLEEDDTDADLSNGTPNIDAILYAFENHKIYPSDADVPPAAPKDLEYDEPISGHPNFDWTTNTEPDLDGYNIYRRKMGEGSFSKQNASLITNTTWTDVNVTVDTEEGVSCDYYLTAVDDEDNESNKSDYAFVPIDQFKPIAFDYDNNAIPSEHSLSQAYPNPFNPSTKIRFGLPEDHTVKIQVFNLKGQLVATLVDGKFTAGFHTVTFNAASSLSSGVYFYKIVAGEFVDIKRMLLIK